MIKGVASIRMATGWCRPSRLYPLGLCYISEVQLSELDSKQRNLRHCVTPTLCECTLVTKLERIHHSALLSKYGNFLNTNKQKKLLMAGFKPQTDITLRSLLAVSWLLLYSFIVLGMNIKFFFMSLDIVSHVNGL